MFLKKMEIHIHLISCPVDMRDSTVFEIYALPTPLDLTGVRYVHILQTVLFQAHQR
jgi:hypothetical protein